MNKNRITRFLSLLLLVSMLASFMSFEAAAEADVWDGTSTESCTKEGTGVKGDPYIIRTAEQLANLASKVNGTSRFADGAYFELANDLDLNGANYSWTPIGKDSSTYRFSGTFIGGGHTISNMTVSSTTTGMGLFGSFITGEICQLNIVDATVKNTNTSGYAGALVGTIYSGAKICNVHVYGSSVEAKYAVGGIVGVAADNTATTIVGCSFENNGEKLGSVKTTGVTLSAAGGILGGVTSDYQFVKISDCWCTGSNITSSNSFAGGIVGSSKLGKSKQIFITDCFNSSAVTVNGVYKQSTTVGGYSGGIIGWSLGNDDTISSCCNIGAVTGGSGSSTYGTACAGGIVGYGSTPSITKCYNAGDVKVGGSNNDYNLSATIATYSPAITDPCGYLTGCLKGSNTVTASATKGKTLQGTEYLTKGTFATDVNAVLKVATLSANTDDSFGVEFHQFHITNDKGEKICNCGPEVEYCTVTFNANGGSGTMTAAQAEKNSDYTLPECTFIAPEGKLFDCWKIGETSYAVGASIKVTANIEVVAQWKTAHTHTYGNPVYSWVGAECTATRTCSKCEAGTDGHSISETKTGTYKKDTDATCTANETGHYEVTFDDTQFGTAESEPFDIPETALGHDFQGEAVCNHDGTHSFKCTRCTATGATESCADENGDHKCDKCEDVLEYVVTFVQPTTLTKSGTLPTVQSVTVAKYGENKTITLPGCQNSRGTGANWSYIFRGWRLADDTAGTWRSKDAEYVVTGDVTFTGVWRLWSIDGDDEWDYIDAMTIMAYLQSQTSEFAPEQIELMDFNGDGVTDYRDAMAIMSYLNGKTPFPFVD